MLYRQGNRSGILQDDGKDIDVGNATFANPIDMTDISTDAAARPDRPKASPR
jgi:hypothetical protein